MPSVGLTRSGNVIDHNLNNNINLRISHVISNYCSRLSIGFRVTTRLTEHERERKKNEYRWKIKMWATTAAANNRNVLNSVLIANFELIVASCWPCVAVCRLSCDWFSMNYYLFSICSSKLSGVENAFESTASLMHSVESWALVGTTDDLRPFVLSFSCVVRQQHRPRMNLNKILGSDFDSI